MSLAKELTERGFVHQYSAESLEEIVDGEKRTIYHGIDPSADSAHAGNFVNWILLRHFVQAGHEVIFLVGGGTGMIGDPKPDVERTLTSPEVVEKRVQKLKTQAQQLLGSDDIEFVNNNNWLGSLNLITFLRDIGKHFTINELIKKDAIATRLNSEVGLSYTEFAYPLLQAYDYLQLHQKYGCDLQIGGSDQWGNIISGVDLIRRTEQKKVYALTQPLVVDKVTGKKFGKSEGNAIWLDAEKTSPYTFYQFWLNVGDESVIDYLKRFTFISLGKISEIEDEFSKNPGVRVAQKKLAEEVTKFVHGEGVMQSVAKVSGILFGDGDIAELQEEEQKILLENAPTCTITLGTDLVSVLVESGLATSKREARTFVESGAVVFSGEKVTDIEFVITKEQFAQNITVLRRGKKQLCILKLT